MEHSHLPMSNHRTEILRELIGSSQCLVLDAQWLELSYLPQREFARVADEEPSSRTRRKRRPTIASCSLLFVLLVRLQPCWLLSVGSEIVMDDGGTPPVAPCSDFCYQMRDVLLPRCPALMQVSFVGVQFASAAADGRFLETPERPNSVGPSHDAIRARWQSLSDSLLAHAA